MAKNMTLLVSGAPEGRNHFDLAIEPGSTARDIKRQVGLPDDYLISREGSGQYFADNEELFGLAEGAKLRATPPATVGGTHATGRRIVVDAISAVAVWHP